MPINTSQLQLIVNLVVRQHYQLLREVTYKLTQVIMQTCQLNISDELISRSMSKPVMDAIGCT